MKVKNILVSQPRPASEKSPYFEMEEKYGVNFTFHQFIRIEELSSKEFRQQHISILDYNAIILNSRHGVDHFFHLCEEMRIKIPEEMHYYCISEAIGNYLQKYIEFRKRRVFFSPNNKLEDLIPMMKRRPGDKFLMVMSDISGDEAIQMFAKSKITVQPAVFYRTVNNPLPAGEKHDYDMFVLFTATGVKAFQESYPNFEQGEKVMACFGANTAAAMKEAGLRVDVQAPTPKTPSITAAIDEFLHNNHKRVR